MSETISSGEHSNEWHEYAIHHVLWSAYQGVVCEQDAQHTPLFLMKPTRALGFSGKRPNIEIHAILPPQDKDDHFADGRKISRKA